jgi:hypothetical protein
MTSIATHSELLSQDTFRPGQSCMGKTLGLAFGIFKLDLLSEIWQSAGFAVDNRKHWPFHRGPDCQEDGGSHSGRGHFRRLWARAELIAENFCLRPAIVGTAAPSRRPM